MKLNATSEKNLKGVHPKLVEIVRRAAEITTVDFVITEGTRTMARQKQLVAKGASKTLKSRHIPDNNKCKMACAVDLAAVISGKVRWDWPLYHKLAAAMKQAAKELGTPLEWGGDWRTFKDGPHFQLPWKSFP